MAEMDSDESKNAASGYEGGFPIINPGHDVQLVPKWAGRRGVPCHWGGMNEKRGGKAFTSGWNANPPRRQSRRRTKEIPGENEGMVQRLAGKHAVRQAILSYKDLVGFLFGEQPLRGTFLSSHSSTPCSSGCCRACAGAAGPSPGGTGLR
jgi:hypothetical protein